MSSFRNMLPSFLGGTTPNTVTSASTNMSQIFLYIMIVLGLVISIFAWTNIGNITTLPDTACKSSKDKLTVLNTIILMVGVAVAAASAASLLCFIKCNLVGYSMSRYAIMTGVLGLVMLVVSIMMLAAIGGDDTCSVSTGAGSVNAVSTVKTNAIIMLVMAIALTGGSGYIIYSSGGF